MGNVRFKIPGSIQHDETKRFIRDLVRKLNDENKIGVSDIPNLHRLATSFDQYLTAINWLSDHSMITTNNKGEEVKHPYVNIAREAWAQYLDVAKQYGLTIKSKAQIDSHKPGDVAPDTPLDEYIREKRTRG